MAQVDDLTEIVNQNAKNAEEATRTKVYGKKQLWLFCFGRHSKQMLWGSWEDSPRNQGLSSSMMDKPWIREVLFLSFLHFLHRVSNTAVKTTWWLLIYAQSFSSEDYCDGSLSSMRNEASEWENMAAAQISVWSFPPSFARWEKMKHPSPRHQMFGCLNCGINPQNQVEQRPKPWFFAVYRGVRYPIFCGDCNKILQMPMNQSVQCNVTRVLNIAQLRQRYFGVLWSISMYLVMQVLGTLSQEEEARTSGQSQLEAWVQKLPQTKLREKQEQAQELQGSKRKIGRAMETQS